MNDDTPYTKREQDSFMSSVNSRFDKLDRTLERIEEQTTPITAWSSEAKAVIEKLVRDTESLKRDRTRIYTIIAVFLAIGVGMGYLFYNLIDVKIQADTSIQIPIAVNSGIQQYFSEHYSKVEVINP